MNWKKMIIVFVVMSIVEAAVIGYHLFIRYAVHPHFPLEGYHYVLLVVLVICNLVLGYSLARKRN